MKIVLMFAALICYYLSGVAFAEEGTIPMDHMMHHQFVMDGRISLGLSPTMKQQQLQNMRSHVAAIQSIVGHLAKGEFDLASQTAYSQLGLTEDMKKMCVNMSDNKEFADLGIAFHKSGDALGIALQTNDLKNSLRALHDTMEYCVQCHAKFRQ